MAINPECKIDFRRRLSLPFGIAPEELAADRISEYLASLNMGVEIQNNTFSEFIFGAPNRNKVKSIQFAASTDKVLLPNLSDIPGYETQELSLSNISIISVIDKVKNQTRIAASMNLEDVAIEMQKKVQFDSVSQSISKLPAPFYNNDVIRAFWPKQNSAGFIGVLGMDSFGVLPTNGVFPSNLPEYLLETYTTATEDHIGELDRLLLRSPVAGSVRFEPYYHFRLNGGDIRTICQSASGRLVIQTPETSEILEFTREIKDGALIAKNKTMTQLLNTATFIIENVDKESVIPHLYRLFVFQFSNYKNILEVNKKTSSTLSTEYQRLKLMNPNKPALKNLTVTMRRALQGWLLFMRVLHPSANDLIIYNSLQTEIKNRIEKGQLDENELVRFIDDIIGNNAWLSNFLSFVENYYIPLLVGVSWYDVLSKTGVHAQGIRFPVPVDSPPKSTGNRDEQKAHADLEAIQNIAENWMVCYSGCPLGYPSEVYRANPIQPDQKVYPDGSLTVYEVEALHIASKSPVVFPGLAGSPNLGRLPQSGVPMDLSDYSVYKVGYSSSLRINNNGYFTLVNWLNEELKELNLQIKEEEKITLTNYFDLTSSSRHPIAIALNYEDYLRAKSIRQRMDALFLVGIGEEGLNWWQNIRRPFLPAGSGTWPDGDGPAPKEPFDKDKTVIPPYDANKTVTYDNGEKISGFDIFDIESMLIACSKVKNILTDRFDIPLPIIMALCEREGVRSYAWLNRTVHDLWWISHQQQIDLSNIGYHDSIARQSIARQFWLLWPYGLDNYNNPYDTSNYIGSLNDRFTSVVNKKKNLGILSAPNGIDVMKYINERLYSRWNSASAASTAPEIKKLTRQCHWPFIVLMLARFQFCHKFIRNKTNTETFSDANKYVHTNDAWFQNDHTSDYLSLGPVDQGWKDFITYYSIIYLAHNSKPSTWSKIIQQVEDNANRGGLSVRDYLLFKYIPEDTENDNITHMIRFAISLDAYMRLVVPHGDILVNRTTAWGL
jgi:hypothetical protein